MNFMNVMRFDLAKDIEYDGPHEFTSSNSKLDTKSVYGTIFTDDDFPGIDFDVYVILINKATYRYTSGSQTVYGGNNTCQLDIVINDRTIFTATGSASGTIPAGAFTRTFLEDAGFFMSGDGEIIRWTKSEPVQLVTHCRTNSPNELNAKISVTIVPVL